MTFWNTFLNLKKNFSFLSPGVLNYWVGKQSLKRWKAIAKEELDEKIIGEADLFYKDQQPEKRVDPDAEQAHPDAVQTDPSEDIPMTSQNGDEGKQRRSQRRKGYEDGITVSSNNW